MTGVSDGEFAPDGTVSQEVVLTALRDLAVIQDWPGAADSQYPYDWALAAGVVTADDWSLPIGEPVTREGLAAYLARYGQLRPAAQEAQDVEDAQDAEEAA